MCIRAQRGADVDLRVASNGVQRTVVIHECLLCIISFGLRGEADGVGRCLRSFFPCKRRIDIECQRFAAVTLDGDVDAVRVAHSGIVRVVGHVEAAFMEQVEAVAEESTERHAVDGDGLAQRVVHRDVQLGHGTHQLHFNFLRRIGRRLNSQISHPLHGQPRRWKFRCRAALGEVSALVIMDVHLPGFRFNIGLQIRQIAVVLAQTLLVGNDVHLHLPYGHVVYRDAAARKVVSGKCLVDRQR